MTTMIWDGTRDRVIRSPRCTATNTTDNRARARYSKTQCSNRTSHPSGLCWRHQ